MGSDNLPWAVGGLLESTARALHGDLADVQSVTRQPSLVAGVVREGRLVWTGARGTAVGSDGDLRPGPEVQYRIGSITKMVTAVAVLQCRDEGLLDLGDPVGAHLGDVPFASARVRDLLVHAAGLPAEPAGPWWERHDGGDFQMLVGQVLEQELVHPAGRRHHYTNLGFGLLGELLARLRGTSWTETVTERVLAPLGMTRTTYRPQAPHAQGWSVQPYAGTLTPEPHSDTGAMAAAGQLWSTVQDLARYAAFWIDPDPAVLAPSTVAEMCTPAVGEPGAGTEKVQGLGVRLYGRGERTLVGHSGSMPGFLAGFAVDPVRGTAGITLANATIGATPELALTLLDRLEDLEPPLPREWSPEPEVGGAAELLGTWFWGNTPMTFAIRDRHLVIDHTNPGRRTRLVRESADTWRGLDHYFAGEQMRVLRDRDGGITHLDLVTYTLTRAPSTNP
ncbi:MAG: beta-lactamase family protein [Actinomycetota bacterium]|nr:beta-lactamase family protein [Actinomycetota bacterium]